MSFVASFPSGLEACFVCDLVCEWSRVSLWPRSPVASKKVSFVVSSARGRTLPSGAASGGFWDVTWKLLGTSELPRECLGVLRGRLGEAFGSFGGVLGGFWELLEPLETPLGASGASQGGSWVLPEHLREALGSSRDALGSVSGCFWDVSGSLLGLRESVGSGQDAKVKIIAFLKEFVGF